MSLDFPAYWCSDSGILWNFNMKSFRKNVNWSSKVGDLKRKIKYRKYTIVNNLINKETKITIKW